MGSLPKEKNISGLEEERPPSAIPPLAVSPHPVSPHPVSPLKKSRARGRRAPARQAPASPLAKSAVSAAKPAVVKPAAQGKKKAAAAKPAAAAKKAAAAAKPAAAAAKKAAAAGKSAGSARQAAAAAEPAKASQASQACKAALARAVAREEGIDSLIEKIKEYSPKANGGEIAKAYEYAAKAHEGQTRRGGGPYITHPLAVAHILADLRMDQESLITALLHDVVEDTPRSLGDIKKEFGPTIAFLVDGVTKISQADFRSAHHKQSENIRKMIVAMGKDVRVILVKLADRLHNLRTLDCLPAEKRLRIAGETLDIYAPLASRLGMGELKTEMEDLSFKYVEPEICRLLQKKMADPSKDREVYTDKVIRILKTKLQKSGIWECEVSGRCKNLYSIHRKMTLQNLSFEEIHDLVAFRICVRDVHECYEALGLTHALWRPVPQRFKDFISMPKSNNYQSLHTTVIGPEGRQIEIQIRTFDMHLTAEKGIAAHWMYKMESQNERALSRSAGKFNWLRDLVSLHQSSFDSSDFLENVKLDLFESEIYVFTPEGDIKEFPKGATPVDFAYAIHTGLGAKMAGAKINGRQAPLKHKLQSGDTVEIITSKKQKPSKDWLKICVTSRARSKIRNFFKVEERKKALEIGQKLAEKGCREFKISENDWLSHPHYDSFLKSAGFSRTEDFYVGLGFGKMTFRQLMSFLNRRKPFLPPRQERAAPPPSLPFAEASPAGPAAGSPLLVEGADHVMAHFARCCCPVAGDRIKGYLSRKKGIVVHRAVCRALSEISPDRFIEVDWRREKPGSPSEYDISLHIVCEDKPGALSQMSEAFNFFGLNITEVKAKKLSGFKVSVVFSARVKNTGQVKLLAERLRQVDSVISVARKTDFDM